jgi:hypothetical protein
MNLNPYITLVGYVFLLLGYVLLLLAHLLGHFS